MNVAVPLAAGNRSLRSQLQASSCCLPSRTPFILHCTLQWHTTYMHVHEYFCACVYNMYAYVCICSLNVCLYLICKPFLSLSSSRALMRICLLSDCRVCWCFVRRECGMYVCLTHTHTHTHIHTHTHTGGYMVLFGVVPLIHESVSRIT
jgi:hypothetical protein